jgi:hypothetical protein
MPTLSGSGKALMYSQFGPMRFGATRFGYGSALVYVSIGGVWRRDHMLAASLTITDTLDEVPNRCQFAVRGFTPTVGMEVIITLGSSNNLERLFAGYILHVQQVQAGKDLDVQYHVDCIDYTWLLTFRTVTKQYRTQSASAIAVDLIASYASGFTTAHVETGLESIDEITFTNEDLPTCLTRLAKRIGAYWRPDYVKDVHFGITDDATNPVDLTSTHPTLSNLAYDRDLSQVITRVSIEGYGSAVRTEALVGDTTLQVVDDSFYSSAGGTVVSGPQRITYTAIGSGNILTPTWITVTKPEVTTPKWAGAAYAPALRRFVIVGNATVATSPDGLTWTPRTASWTGQAAGIVWAAERALFVLVTNSGEVETSPDGITWTSQTASAANVWTGITWAPELSGGLFVAVGESGANRVMTSPDGITWTGHTAASALAWRAVAWSASLGLLVAVAEQSGATSAMSSPDGTNWTSRTPSDTGNAWFGVAWSPTVGKFVAAGSTGGIMYSSNGTSWTSIADRAGAANAMTGVLWVPEESRYVAVIYNTTRIFWSTDAITWAEEVIPTGEWALNGPTPFAYGGGTIILTADDNGTDAVICANVSSHYALLTGIPASGAGAIQYAIAEGDAVNILVTVNDTAAQATLAALIGGDGIVEEYVQDRRLSATECTARGQAILDLRSTVEGSLTYRCRDKRTRSGLTITIAIAGTTNISGAFKIQQVTIHDFTNRIAACYPTFDVQASTTRFSFEDMLRQARKAAA